jgi:hypothetical protein
VIILTALPSNKRQCRGAARYSLRAIHAVRALFRSRPILTPTYRFPGVVPRHSSNGGASRGCLMSRCGRRTSTGVRSGTPRAASPRRMTSPSCSCCAPSWSALACCRLTSLAAAVEALREDKKPATSLYSSSSSDKARSRSSRLRERRSIVGWGWGRGKKRVGRSITELFFLKRWQGRVSLP